MDIRNRLRELLAIARYKDPREGPGTQIRISACLKNIHVTESEVLQFRGDFLNAFNNVQLGHPNTNFPSDTFGLINISQPARQHPVRAKVLLLAAY